MIINVWSTPRTGSVWYSKNLADILKSRVVSEMFNPYLMDLYRENVDGLIKNHHRYVPGTYYEEYTVQDGILTVSSLVDKIRQRAPNEEMQYRSRLIQDLSNKNKLVFHNHVHPIDQDIMEKLISIAEKNIWIYRKDKRAQLASYAWAFTTGVFADFSGVEKKHRGEKLVDTLPTQQLKNLVDRIKIWEKIDKPGNIVAYEDINFFNGPGLPVKQLQDYKLVFTGRALNEIDAILSDGGVL